MNHPRKPRTISFRTLDGPMSGRLSAASTATLHYVFLPLVNAPGTPTRPYSLFIRAYVAGTFDTYMYHSDIGGSTCECMEKPQVRRRASLPLLHVREDGHAMRR